MSYRSLFAALVIGLLCAPFAGRAQSPRKYLIEEFTNGNSVTAASFDSMFIRYVNQSPKRGRMVSIVYHPSGSGPDSVNLKNPALHDSRANYYSLNNAPIKRLVNGKALSSTTPLPLPGYRADTAALTAAIGNDISPITIDVESSVQGSKLRGSVTVTSSEALADKRLYIVAMQYSLYVPNAGLTGARVFYYEPRAMVPDENGTALTLAAGEKRTIPVELAIPSDWDRQTLYIAAFVQDPATKEVLQAEDDFMFPLLNIDGSQLAVDPTVRTNEWSGTFGGTVSGRYAMQIYPVLPDGWSYSVTIDGAEVQNGDSIEVTRGAPRPIRVRIIPTDATLNRHGSLMMLLQGSRGPNILAPFSLFSGKIETMYLLRDYARYPIEYQFTSALEECGHPYARVMPYEQDRIDLTKFVTVIIMGKQAFEQQDVLMLERLLVNGARVLISGAEVAFGLADATSPYYMRDTTFLHDYLHVNYVSDDAGETAVKGETNDPIGNDIRARIDGMIGNQDAPDVLGPRDGAIPIFFYGDSPAGVAGIRHEERNHRLVYLGFGLEGIDDLDTRSDILCRSFQWLDRPSSVPAPPLPASLLGDVRPNPADGLVSVPLHLNHAAHCMVTLHDARGAEVARLADAWREAGESTIAFDVSQIPSGIYSVRVAISGNAYSRIITVAH